MTIDELVRQAEALSSEERKELVKRLVDMFDTSQVTRKRHISEFAGIAAHIADDDDPQEYVNRLRDEWDEPQ